MPQVGQRVLAPFGQRKEQEGWIVALLDSCPPELQGITIKELEVVDEQPLFSQKMLSLAQWLASFYLCSLGEALDTLLPMAKTEKEPMIEAPCEEAGALFQREIQLSDEQQVAAQRITEKIGTPAFFYLFGPTGSGKTEVFLQVIQAVLARGRSVIYLVPEISLSYQLHQQLEARLGCSVALLHSHLKANQRLWYWRSLQSGQVKVVLGARSAIFAPLPDLGLVIVDEEHEQSYKAGSTPRYHARQVAMKRCRDEGAILLMGSATPSVEAIHASGIFAEEGSPKPSLELLQLSKRLAGGHFPEITTIDLKQSKSVLSSELVQALEDCVHKGGQGILFLNRRGYTPVVECFSCGKTQDCPHCSISLTYHKLRNRLQCHHCGFRMAFISSCLYCHRPELEFIGFGTEQIEEELERSFSHLRVGRLDTDVSSKKGYSKKILEAFARRELDVLVGTQMVAKGLNFEHVKLVGVILADTSLNMPDFRAAERTYNLLVQVAGRAGRFSPDGRVFIQSYQPANQIIRWASELNWQEFYQNELKVRRQTSYPPFSRLLRLVFRGKNLAKLEEAAQYWAGQLRAAAQENPNGQNWKVLGPAECPYAKVAGNYRLQLLVRTQSFQGLHYYVEQLLLELRGNQVYVEVDVDPQSLM